VTHWVKLAVGLNGMVNDMLSAKDNDFLNYLRDASEAGKIRWQPTAGESQFTASLKGKYNVVTGTDRDGPWVKMTNEQDQMMLFIHAGDDMADRVERIFIAARRVGLDVDAAIDDIISGE
jgi:hypothetical protein